MSLAKVVKDGGSVALGEKLTGILLSGSKWPPQTEKLLECLSCLKNPSQHYTKGM